MLSKIPVFTNSKNEIARMKRINSKKKAPLYFQYSIEYSPRKLKPQLLTSTPDNTKRTFPPDALKYNSGVRTHGQYSLERINSF